MVISNKKFCLKKIDSLKYKEQIWRDIVMDGHIRILVYTPLKIINGIATATPFMVNSHTKKEITTPK